MSRERTFGRRKKEIPKNRSEVSCPHCGAKQWEPTLAVSTFCRSCGEHIRLEDGEAVHPRKSPILAVRAETELPTAESPKSEPLSASASTTNLRGKGRSQQFAESPAPASPGEIGIAKPRRAAPLIQVGESAPPIAAPGGAPLKATSSFPGPDALVPKSRAAGPPGSPIAPDSLDSEEQKKKTAPQSTFSKLSQLLGKKDSSRQVRCFECKHEHTVPSRSTSTLCPSCGSYISLQNEQIATSRGDSIKTRGDVTILKKGALTGRHIVCHNLKISGGISGAVDCSGQTHFRASNKIIGDFKSQTLLIDKKVEVTFLKTAQVESANILGKVRGNIYCSGKVCIGAKGVVEGDVTAKAVSVDPGGLMLGQLTIGLPSKLDPQSPDGLEIALAEHLIDESPRE